MTKDFEIYNQTVKFDKDGNKLNPIQLKDVTGTDVKVIAAKLAYINEHATTHGEYFKIGTLYGFNLFVKTDDSKKVGLDFKENHFFVEGEGNIKYTYNNGHIASEPKLAVAYFLNALEKIPKMIDKYQKDTKKKSMDLPVLREVANSSWRKENELKDLKSELATLNRNIQLSLKPIEQGESSDIQQNRFNSHETIQDLLSGKISNLQSYSIQGQLQNAKEEMSSKGLKI
jgi:hypothetical protein